VVAAPGTLVAHYAPAARVVVVEPDEVVGAAAELVAAGERVALLTPAPVVGVDPAVIPLDPAGGTEHYARVLYQRLREADRLGAEVVLAVPPPAEGLGVAVRDRLERAARAQR